MPRGGRAQRRGGRYLDQLIRERGQDPHVCVRDAPTPNAIRKAAISNELPAGQITQVRVLDPYFYA